MLLEDAGFEITYAKTYLFTPPADAQCEEEEQNYVIIARKVSRD